MENKPLNFVLIGRSGSGKGTQAKLLKNYLEKNTNIPVLYVYAGDKMRELIEDKDSFTAKLTNEIFLAGRKEPDFLAVWAWSNELVEKLKENTHLIIDGSPRSLIEAKVLDEAFEFYKRGIVKPIYLDVGYDWAFQRLIERKRFDDTEEKIRNRLDYFEKLVKLAVEYYEKESKNKLIRINGEQTIEKVHQDIIKALNL